MMRSTISIASAIALIKFASCQPDFQSLGSAIQLGPFANFGSSALDAFSGVSGNFAELGIGAIFKRIVETSRATEESPESTAHKFLRYASPIFPTDTIEQFLTSPLNLVDGNAKLSSFFEQTQAIARHQFAHNAASPRQLQKQVEEYRQMYRVFSDIGKNSFLDNKSPEDAATSFLTQLSAFPSATVGSFLTIPSMMQNVPVTSFFAQMRDTALQLNSEALTRRRLQVDLPGATDAVTIANRVTDNIPFASQFNIQDAFTNPLKGIQSVNPLNAKGPFAAFDNVISEINPLNRISSVSAENDTGLLSLNDFSPNSKFFAYFRGSQ